MADKSRSEHLIIYLVKKGFEKPADCISDISGLTKIDLSEDGGPLLGSLYIQARSSNPPKWAKFFASQVAATKFGRVSSAAAVLHLVVDGRACLVTFGQGRHLLDQEKCEDRFGLLVTLNSIGEASVRSIDKSTLDPIGRHTKVQASREAAPSEFGFDIERDLLRAITGTPETENLGKRLSGLESLHAVVQVDLQSLKEKLSLYLTQFAKHAYKKKFPWIDHISEVTDAVKLAHLDALMVKVFQKGDAGKCWMAVPEPIDWQEVVGFRYGAGAKHATVYDIRIETFLEDSNLKEKDVSAELLNKKAIFAVDANDETKRKWSAYRCVYCEVEYSGDTYLLTNGKWYKIQTDFVQEVNKYFDAAPRYDVDLPLYEDASEGAYNKRVAGMDAKKYACMDMRLISIGGGYSRIEFCDLFTDDQHLIHVKRYGGSGVLSHLFSQGVVSGQLFASADEFRGELNKLLPKSHKLADPVARPDVGAYRVVFAIISAEPGDKLTLPFFSKLTTRQAFQTLEGYGYQAALAKIHVAPTKAKTKKYPTKKKAKH